MASDSNAKNIHIIAETDTSIARLYEGAPVVRLEPSVNQETHPSTIIDGLPSQHRTALECLALAETKKVTLTEWSALCDLWGHPTDSRTLRHITAEQQQLLTLLPDSGDSGGGEQAESTGNDEHTYVAFVAESTAQALRQGIPDDASQTFHTEIVRRFFSHRTDGDTGHLTSYWYRALAPHAAAAGQLAHVLDDPAALGQCERNSLLEALPTGFPDGVPPDSRAASLHYLDERGIAPSSHAEWVAWLHHTAVTWGDTAAADTLASAFAPLPWRTVWSHWNPPGRFDPPEVWTGPIEALRPAERAGYVISTGEDGVERTWEAATGRPVGPPESADAPQTGTPDTPAGWEVEHDQRFWHSLHLRRTGGNGETGVLRLPNVEASLAVGELVVLGGARGLYAIEIAPDLLPQEDLPYALLAHQPHGHVVPRAFDEEQCRPTAERWAALFGTAAVRRIAEADLPSGLTHPGSRAFLSTVGFPAVEDFYSLYTVNVAQDGLALVTEPVPRSPKSPVPEGPLYRLGTWIGGILCLDGSTGRMFRLTTPEAIDANEPSVTPVGTDLAAFTSMLMLHWGHMLAYTQSGGIDAGDNLAELDKWLREVDPEPAAARAWQHVLDPDNFYTL
ncbi:SUKH-4 family immunity protein [Streptomyces sp. NPDC050161]|uniref:SUKH-4 family immunity protein n=1 Tax=Streptomyces sp. NPDC050161 TaxID=3365604 RepID=UPI0037AA0778